MVKKAKPAPLDKGQLNLIDTIAEVEYVPPAWLTTCNWCLNGDHDGCDAWNLQFCRCGHRLTAGQRA